MKTIHIDKILVALLLVLLGANMPVKADTIATSSEAASLYEKGEYVKAADAWLAIEKRDGSSAGLMFNLANAYAQTGDYGRAMLYYSRARRLDPRNEEIANNLNYCASKVEDANRAELRGKKISVTPDHETFFQTADRVISRDVRSDTWAVWSAVCFIAFLACVAIYLFCSNVLLRKSGFFGGLAFLGLSILTIVFAFMAARSFDSHDRGVLMAYKTELLVEPSSDSKPSSSNLCQGTCFDIVAEETDVMGSATWYKVRLNSNIIGWVRASDVEII